VEEQPTVSGGGSRSEKFKESDRKGGGFDRVQRYEVGTQFISQAIQYYTTQHNKIQYNIYNNNNVDPFQYIPLTATTTHHTIYYNIPPSKYNPIQYTPQRTTIFLLLLLHRRLNLTSSHRCRLKIIHPFDSRRCLWIGLCVSDTSAEVLH